MPRPDNEFINQFREKFGDLLLGRQGGRGLRGSQFVVGDPMLPASYASGNEPIDVASTDEAITGQTLKRESGYAKYHSFHAPADLFSPIIKDKEYKTFHDCNPGSGAVFYNNLGDIRSTMVQLNPDISPTFDKPFQPIPQNF
ncbi:unnamed protein product [Penicillium nalgiovense]|uniref:Uncharacterized protein n=1 Tax=Penicillium nalgiovense TaxID=60175 RepID=A0A1V6X4N5_PENNA|nr:hypothetical protein PENNAL_c0125G07710 [Penicillium nalgiovense]CAG7937597.1 unnamed protein product [Penicillium nalgiovense]CAG8017439.1 unnamed protein product [Penicillium nalgiovense]CAG8055428.1 unnamed protein product [Penicillium nalgiovense]CAG8073637.1 unnamed protein product [Penicillium nalgiovense]